MMTTNSQRKVDWENYENMGKETYNECYKTLIGVELPTLDTIVEKIAGVLEVLVERNKDSFCEDMKFTTNPVPSISIRNYLKRIKRYSHCSIETYIYSLIYIDRLIWNGTRCVKNNNVHKILITSIVIASKYNDDKRLGNKSFAKIAGISVKELNVLELDFIEKVGWNLCVGKDIFKGYVKMITEISQNQINDNNQD